jgi:hypothetical protein
MQNPVSKVLGGIVLTVFLLFGLESCNLFGTSTGPDFDCPAGAGCVDEPKQTEFEPLDPEFEFVVP